MSTASVRSGILHSTLSVGFASMCPRRTAILNWVESGSTTTDHLSRYRFTVSLRRGGGQGFFDRRLELDEDDLVSLQPLRRRAAESPLSLDAKPSSRNHCETSSGGLGALLRTMCGVSATRDSTELRRELPAHCGHLSRSHAWLHVHHVSSLLSHSSGIAVLGSNR